MPQRADRFWTIFLTTVLVDVASGQSGSHARDLRMQKDVLESAKFPKAIFHPEKVAGSIRIATYGTFS